MPRARTFRLRAACAALAFSASGGLTGMEAHPLSVHGPHSQVSAMELGAHAHQSASTRTGHPSGDPQQQSSSGCTCLGLCQGGASPLLPDANGIEDPFDASDVVLSHLTGVVFVHHDPRSHLLPFPNPPPTRA